MVDCPKKKPRIRVERLRTPNTPGAAADQLLAECREIRQRVFVDEQSVPSELEWDGLDGEAEHFVALATAETEHDPNAARTVVGTARLRSVDGYAKVERVAVVASYRQHGVGRCLMEAVEQRALERGLRELELSAQVRVVPFYERLGYTRRGEVFVQAGIDHLAMSKTLG